MKTAELSKHVRTLCREHRIRLKFHTKGRQYSHADLDDRHVVITAVLNTAAYAIALHEVGHVVTRTKSKPLLFREGAAWAWAREHALCWTPSMQQAMLYSLRSYLEVAQADYDQALPKQLNLPPKGHPFWALLEHEPAVKQLLSKRLPLWANPQLVAIPWGNVLSEPERPRCSNCRFWEHIVTHTRPDTKEKTSMGSCLHRDRPLGVETTPGGALCGTSWLRADG